MIRPIKHNCVLTRDLVYPKESVHATPTIKNSYIRLAMFKARKHSRTLINKKLTADKTTFNNLFRCLFFRLQNDESFGSVG